MTEQEAINRIEQDLSAHSKELSTEYKRAFRLAIEALEKQIPKTTIVYSKMNGIFEVLDYGCPECGRLFYKERLLYCPCCGQKIDWSEEE